MNRHRAVVGKTAATVEETTSVVEQVRRNAHRGLAVIRYFERPGLTDLKRIIAAGNGPKDHCSVAINGQTCHRATPRGSEAILHDVPRIASVLRIRMRSE